MAEVVLIASSFLPRVGGVEEHVRHVAARLRAQGVDVAVWTVDQGDEVPTAVDGVPVRVLPCPMPARTPRALLSFAWRGPVAAVRWAAALARDRPRILHVQCFGPNGAWALPASLGRRLIVTSHGETSADADDVFARSALLRAALRRALRRADAVTVVSAPVARDLVDRFGLREGAAAIISNGVDLGEASGPRIPGLPARYVLGIGRLVETKGFDLLLEAFAQAGLPADVGIVLAGDGPAGADLRAQAGRLGLADRVVFTGRLDRAGIVSVAADAAVLAVPSRMESFGIVVLEGWRAGIPVIATDHGGPAELIRDGVDGILVDPADTPGFAARLAQILADPARARALGAAGRDRAPDYTWEGVAAGYARLYASLQRTAGSARSAHG
ncbi:glycosyltransferase family 4 protein [Microbacterium xylanilyticum]